jgi:hypothetical protein
VGEIRTKRYDSSTAVVEFRVVQLGNEEIRNDGGRLLRGYASVFSSPSEWLGFREVVAPGAFARSLSSGRDIKALVEHDPARIVGRTENGSLELHEDEHGLRVRIDPNDSSEGRDLTENIRTGLLSQMSIGFRVLEETWENRGGEEFRTLVEVDLVEVSIVADPAYTSTEIGVSDRGFDGGVVVVEEDGGAWAKAMAAAIEQQAEPLEPSPDDSTDHSRLRARLDLLERM